MTIVIAELYEALIAADAPCEKARKAAEVRKAGLPIRPGGVELCSSTPRDEQTGWHRDIRLTKWMLGLVLVFEVAIVIKLFVG